MFKSAKVWRGLVALIALVMCAPAAAWAVDYQLGLKFSPLDHYSVAQVDGALYAGAYVGDAPGSVARSLDGGLTWQAGWATSASPVESFSGFVQADGRVLVLSESGTSPAAYVLPDDGGPMVTAWQAQHLDMYLFSGDGAVCVGSNRHTGGYLVDMDGQAITPAMYDEMGRPLFAWDAMQWGGGWVAGTSRGGGDYQAADAGRVLSWRAGADAWSIAPFVGGGVVQVATMPGDVGLWLGTTKGGLYYTRDLVDFKLVLQGPEADMRLFDVAGRRVAVSAAGKVYEDGREVLNIPGADFLSLVPTADGLGGVVNMDDGVFGVKIHF